MRDAETAKSLSQVGDGLVIGISLITELEDAGAHNDEVALENLVKNIRKALDE